MSVLRGNNGLHWTIRVNWKVNNLFLALSCEIGVDKLFFNQ